MGGTGRGGGGGGLEGAVVCRQRQMVLDTEQAVSNLPPNLGVDILFQAAPRGWFKGWKRQTLAEGGKGCRG